MQRPVLDSVEFRMTSYTGLYTGEGRSKWGEGKWRVTEVNGEQSEVCSINLDHAEAKNLEAPN